MVQAFIFIFVDNDLCSIKNINVVTFYQKGGLMRYRVREEEPKSKKIVVNVTPSDHQFLKILAVDNGITMSQFVIRALRHYLQEILKEERDLTTSKEV